MFLFRNFHAAAPRSQSAARWAAGAGPACKSSPLVCGAALSRLGADGLRCPRRSTPGASTSCRCPCLDSCRKTPSKRRGCLRSEAVFRCESLGIDRRGDTEPSSSARLFFAWRWVRMPARPLGKFWVNTSIIGKGKGWKRCVWSTVCQEHRPDRFLVDF